jgi:cytoskeleton protein RodZ
LVGELLRKKREELGKDLRDISKTLKISYSYLKAIEDEDFKKLPEEVYVKGYIREYAEILHIDPDIAIKAYIQQISPPQAEDKETIEKDVVQRKRLKIKHLLIPLLLLFLVITIAFIIFPSSRGKKETPQPRIETKEEIPPPPVENKKEGTTSPAETRKETPSLPAEAKKEMLPPRAETKKEITPPPVGTEKENMLKAKITPHTLEVFATDATWLLITTDKTSTRDMILKKGDSVKLQAKEGFSLKIGNAGGVRLIFDGETIEKIGETGQVVTINLP